MSKYRELDLLREQENTLTQLHMNFSDQLNRLKVEELALTNLLRLQKEREMEAQTGTSNIKTQIGAAEEAIEQETMQVLNLLVSENPSAEQEDEEEEKEADEEEEEEEDGSHLNAYGDQLSSFLENLLHQQKKQQQIQLAVNTNTQDREEEEEEEEDEDT